MINRRRFLQSIAAAAATPALARCETKSKGVGAPLRADADMILDVPNGFSHKVISRRGETMSDGLITPAAHDGMAAFRGENGRVVLIRNHELAPQWQEGSPFGDNYKTLPESIKRCMYDRGGDVTPGIGGTTTSIYNPATQRVERQFLSLAGTEINCAGGKTPWDSWLSCEESFGDPGDTLASNGVVVQREQRHGYVFEVPASTTALVAAKPLKDMGRFEHEAAAVHEPSGAVYLTEDRWHSLLYRFLPNVPGDLAKGGRLQALAIHDAPGKDTHNWDNEDVRIGEALMTHWIELDNVDSDENNLRKRGAAAGAATFARGEGLTAAGDGIAFACSIGGPHRLGQVFAYEPSPDEGTNNEKRNPGKLTLIAQANPTSLLKNCDNLTMAPWGDLIVCEDTVDSTEHCALVGVRPDGSQYLVANNAYSDSELAGVCFSPDGRTLFVNIQYPGMTIAITGPWPV